MPEKYPWIKVNLTKEQKDLLQAEAKAAGMSLSSFARMRLLKEAVPAVPMFAPPPEETGPRDTSLHINVSREELSRIRENAGTMSLSAYLRSAALSGSYPVNLEIYTDDLTELNIILGDRLSRLETYIRILGKNEMIPEGQLERMFMLLSEIDRGIKDVKAAILANRNAIKKAALRELRRQLKKERDKRKAAVPAVPPEGENHVSHL